MLETIAVPTAQTVRNTKGNDGNLSVFVSPSGVDTLGLIEYLRELNSDSIIRHELVYDNLLSYLGYRNQQLVSPKYTYLNEIVEGGNDFGASEVGCMLTNDFLYFGNNGDSIELDSILTRLLKPRIMGGKASQGSFSGLGTKIFMAKHGLPYYILSKRGSEYKAYFIRYEGINDTFKAAEFSGTNWFLEELSITETQYKLLCQFTISNDGNFSSDVFSDVPKFFIGVKKYDDIESILPQNSYNQKEIMRCVSEQTIEFPNLQVKFKFEDKVMKKFQSYYPADINGDLVVKSYTQLPIIIKKFKGYDDYTAEYELRAYTDVAQKTEPAKYSKMLKAITKDCGVKSTSSVKKQIVRGDKNKVARLRHSKLIYMNKQGTIHSIVDLGSSFPLGITVVCRHKGGVSEYELAQKSSDVPITLVEKCKKEVKDYLDRNQGNKKALITARAGKAEDKETDRIGNLILSGKGSQIVQNLVHYSNYELLPSDIMNKNILSYGGGNKYEHRQIDMMFKKEGEKPTMIIEFFTDKIWEHIDRLIALSSHERSARHFVLVVDKWNDAHYKDYIEKHYASATDKDDKPLNFIVTTYSDLEDTADLNPYKR